MKKKRSLFKGNKSIRQNLRLTKTYILVNLSVMTFIKKATYEKSLDQEMDTKKQNNGVEKYE